MRWFVKPEQHSFPTRHLFPQERFFSALRFLMRLLRMFNDFGDIIQKSRRKDTERGTIDTVQRSYH